MEEWGNGRANSFFEAELPSHVVRPKEGMFSCFSIYLFLLCIYLVFSLFYFVDR